MTADDIKPVLTDRQLMDFGIPDIETGRAIELAVLQADRASHADHFRDATNLVNESAAVLDVLTSVLPPGHRLRQDAERGAKRLVAGLYELAASFSTDAAPSPQGDAVWMLIEEDAPIDVPMDTSVLLAWWDDWSEEWKIEANYAGSEQGGWRHGRATHWMPLPDPPAARAARSTPAKGGE